MELYKQVILKKLEEPDKNEQEIKEILFLLSGSIADNQKSHEILYNWVETMTEIVLFKPTVNVSLIREELKIKESEANKIWKELLKSEWVLEFVKD